MKTNEGELFKQRITRYYDAEGKRVRAGTPGARKEVVESKKWYARLKDPSTRKWRLYRFFQGQAGLPTGTGRAGKETQ